MRSFILFGTASLITGVFFSLNTYSQQFGGNPPGLKWQQINTPAARVIFPKGLDSTAKEVAYIIDRLSTPGAFSIGSKQRKVSVVLQNQTTVSNGYVGLGPFRSEFYLTPLQNSFRLGSLPWPKQLAIHEFRHVQQYNNFNVGLSKAFRIVFGEEGQALANAMSVPDWFFEGDAVFNETQVSEQGRGRLPFFYNGYRSLWAANKEYSWMKLRNGSFKDYTPDHYPLGYMLVAYGYEKYGNEFWKNVTQDAAAFKGLFYPFQKAVKKYSGKSYVDFRKEALNYFREQLDSEVIKKEASPAALPKTVTDEEYPAYLNDHTVVFLKSSYKQIPAFIIRTDSSEKKLRVKDISLDEHFSYRNNRIVYSGYRPDLRWSYKNYGVINVLDVTNGKQRTITSHTKYFTPDINEDGTEIVAVENSTDGKSTLHILNGNNGALLKAVNNPEGLLYTYPKFYSATQIIAAVRNKDGKMSMAIVNTDNGSTEYLLPFSYNVLGFPVIQKDTLYFTASAQTTDRMFALDIKSKKLFSISIRASANDIGFYQPAVYNGHLTYTAFTASGFQLRSYEYRSYLNPVSASYFAATDDLSISALQKGKGDLTRVGNDSVYTAVKYPKSFRLFNFHSLEPYFDDPDYQISVFGENVLNTLQTELSFSYNRNEQYKQLGFSTTYGALFPYLTLGANYAFDRRATYQTSDNKRYRVYFDQAQIYGGLQVPLNLSRGRNSTSLTFGSQYVYNNPRYKGFFKDSIGDRSYCYLNNFISFSNQIQVARQQIFPRLAQTLSLNYKGAVTRLKGRQFQASANLYFPGLFLTHNLIFNLALSARDNDRQIFFSNSLPFSRGYYSDNFYRMYKAGANYHLPLAYPDLGIGNIVYFQRVRANAFFDFTRVKDFASNKQLVTVDFRSVGTEVYFDIKWWNDYAVTFGFRYSHLLDGDLDGRSNNYFEFILPVNLFGR